MARVFELGVECGPAPGTWHDMAAHFERLSLVLSSGTHVPCYIECSIPWVIVNPGRLSTHEGMLELRSQSGQRALGNRLYEHLLIAPLFRFAVVGWDVGGWREYEEIDADDISDPIDGLIISTEIWERFGKPNVYVDFRPGYVRCPYLCKEWFS